MLTNTSPDTQDIQDLRLRTTEDLLQRVKETTFRYRMRRSRDEQVEIDSRPPGYFESLLRPGETIISYGQGQSDENSNQLPLAVRRVKTTLRFLAQSISKSHCIGPKSDCPAIYQGIPIVQRDWDSCLKINCAGTDILAIDLDGAIKSYQDLERVKSLFSGSEYVLHTSGSHNPLGGHPNPASEGQHRWRLFLRWSRRLSYQEHRIAALETLCTVASELGHVPPPELCHSKLSTWLLDRGVDPACARGMQPSYFPRHPNEEVAAQFEVMYHEGGGLDPAPALQAGDERVARVVVIRSLRPPKPEQEKLEHICTTFPQEEKIEKARQYLVSLGPCLKGQGGHEKNFRGVLGCWNYDLSLSEAWDVLMEWNCVNGAERQVSRKRLEDAFWGGITTPRGCWVAPQESANGASLRTQLGFSGASEGFCTTPFHSSLKEGEGRDTSKYLPMRTSFKKRITFVKAPTGCGKTTSNTGIVGKLLKALGRVLAVTHRRALTRDLCKTLGLPYYEDTKGKIHGSTGLCLPSIGRYSMEDPECEEGPNMIAEEYISDLTALDESEQLVRFLFSPICAQDRAVIYSSLKQILLGSRNILLQDADLGPLTAALVSVVFGPDWRDITDVQEHPVPPGIRVNITESRAHHLHRILELLERRTRGEGPKLWEHCTSKAEVEARVMWIQETFPELKVVGFHSESVEEYKHLILDKVALSKYDAVIYSPTLGSGFNFDNSKIPDSGEFAVFGTCGAGGSLAQDCKQGLSRVRHPYNSEWNVLVEGPSQGLDTYHRTYEDFFADIITRSAKSEELLKQIHMGWEDKYDTTGEYQRHPQDPEVTLLACHVLAHEARWKNLKGVHGALREHLQSCGYEVEYRTQEEEDPSHTDTGKVCVQAIKEAKKEAKEQEQEEVLYAPEISEEEASELQSRQLKKPQARALTRHKIQSYLTCKYSEVTPQHIQWWGGSRARGPRQATAFTDLLNVFEGHGQAVLYQDLKTINMGFRSDLKNRFLKAKFLQALLKKYGVLDLRGGPSSGIKITPPSDLSKATRKAIVLIWGYRGAMKKTPMEILSYLMSTVGIKLGSKQKRTPTGKIREYWVNHDSLTWSLEVSLGQLERSRKDRRELDPVLSDPMEDPTWNPNSAEIQAALLDLAA